VYTHTCVYTHTLLSYKERRVYTLSHPLGERSVYGLLPVALAAAYERKRVNAA